MIPLRDDLRTLRFPLLTVLLIAVNIGVFVWQTQVPEDPALSPAWVSSGVDQSAIEYGAIPDRLTHPGESDCALGARAGEAEIVCGDAVRAADEPLEQAAWWLTILTSMFMHGGILHLGLNMLFLWIFGNNIEDSLGRPRFAAFYLLAGIAAVYAQSVADPGSTVPTIGASGAIAGVLGGYALLHPRARVLTLVFVVLFVTLIEIPAIVLLAVWFALQFIPALGQTAVPELAGDPSVAYLAHVGGFVFGLLAIKLFARHRRGPPTPGYG